MAFKRSGVRFPSPPSEWAAPTQSYQPVAISHQLKRRETDTSDEKYRKRLFRKKKVAGIAQLVEHNLAKVGVAGSSPVSRSFVGCSAAVGRLAQLVRAPR